MVGGKAASAFYLIQKPLRNYQYGVCLLCCWDVCILVRPGVQVQLHSWVKCPDNVSTGRQQEWRLKPLDPGHPCQRFRWSLGPWFVPDLALAIASIWGGNQWVGNQRLFSLSLFLWHSIIVIITKRNDLFYMAVLVSCLVSVIKMLPFETVSSPSGTLHKE